MAEQEESWVRSCCNEGFLVRKQEVFAGRGLVMTSLLLRGEKSVKTAMLTFSNKLHFIPCDALETLAHPLLCIFASAHGATR